MDNITQETIKHVLLTVQNIEGLLRDPSGAGLWCTGPVPYKNWPLCSHGQEKAHYVLAPNMDIEKKVEEPVKVRVERNKEYLDREKERLVNQMRPPLETTLEQEIGLSAQPQGMETEDVPLIVVSPITTANRSDVRQAIMNHPIPPSLPSDPVTTNQSHVEPVSKCAHNQGVRIGEVHQKDMELAKVFRGQCRICNVWLSFELIPARPVQEHS